MEILRTPDDRFDALPDFPFEPRRAGARQFPVLVPISSDDPVTAANDVHLQRRIRGPQGSPT